MMLRSNPQMRRKKSLGGSPICNPTQYTIMGIYHQSSLLLGRLFLDFSTSLIHIQSWDAQEARLFLLFHKEDLSGLLTVV